MVKATQTKWLMTRQDYLLPEMCFRDEYNLGLDKQAQILLNQCADKVFMYEGNFTYPQKSFTLFDHKMGLVDVVRVQPKIKQVLDHPQDAPPDHVVFVNKTMQGIDVHDGGEVPATEPMTFSLKCTHGELIPSAKAMEKFMAPMGYRLALGAALLGQSTDFRREITKVQKQFRKDLQKAEANFFAQQFYKAATDTAISSVDSLWKKTEKRLGLKDRELIENMVVVFTAQYNAIEDPTDPSHGPAQKFVKVVDKNCPSYTDYAKKRYLKNTEKTPTHDRFSSSMVYDDLNRSEKPLIVYASSCTDDTALHFLSTAQDITFGHMMDYAATMPPVYFGKGVKAPKEVSMYEPRAVWLESMIDKMAIITGRREKGTHFLEDEIKTNLELYALLKTKGETGKYMNRSIFDTVNYSPDFCALAEQNLLDISRKPLIEKHPDYQLSFFA